MADTATATERPNTVSISDAGPSRKKISIEVPAETVTEKLRESLDTLSVEAEMPGFRKGRAPRALVQKRFGPALRDEAKKQIVSAAYTKAVEEHKLKVVGEPTSETLDKLDLAEGKPLVFDLEVEVMPEFEMPSLDGIAVRRPLFEVTDAMVNEEVNKLRINEGRLEALEAPEAGDYLTGRGVMTGKDGTEFYNINGAVIQLPTPDKGGKGMILGIMVEDLEKQVGKPKPGETVTVKAKGPEQHEIEGVRNNDLTITFAVERADRIIPAPVEDILAQYGFQSEDQLRDAVRQRMQQRVMVQQQTVMRQQVAQHLLDKTEMDLPERLTAGQAARTLQRQRLELMYRGVEPATIEERIAELRNASQDLARRELKLFFILNHAADDLSIQVTEGEINGRIAQMAMERNMRPEALRQELIQRQQVGGIFQQIREHKTFDAILGKATITDMPAEEFNKVMAEEAKARGESEPKSEAKPKKSKAKADDAEGQKAEGESKPKSKSKKKS